MKSYTKHIAVFGSARSGTSWLAEIIARQHRYRLLFEPEHPINTKKGKLISDVYLTKNQNDKQIDAYLKQVFANRVDNDWIAQLSNRKYKRHLWPYIPKKYVIKFVRCNLMAAYISEQFQMPLIHIVRNPYDVISSQQRVKFPWLYDMSSFTNQPQLLDLIWDKYGMSLDDIKKMNDVETLAFRWCLENEVPLQTQAPYTFKHKVVRHEILRGNLQEFLSLCDFFNLEPLENIHDEYTRPSSKTHPKSAIRSNKEAKQKLESADIKKINTILDIFESQQYPRE